MITNDNQQVKDYLDEINRLQLSINSDMYYDEIEYINQEITLLKDQLSRL